MARFFGTVFGGLIFTGAMLAIAATNMPPWGPFCIGGAGAMLGGWWYRSL